MTWTEPRRGHFLAVFSMVLLTITSEYSWHGALDRNRNILRLEAQIFMWTCIKEIELYNIPLSSS